MLPEPTTTLRRVASSGLPAAEKLSANLAGGILAEIPELAEDRRTAELFQATVIDNVVSALRAVASGETDLDVAAPPVALEFARRLAQQGVAITTMLRAYRLGQATFQQHMIAEITNQNPSAAEIADAAMALSSFAFSFIDRVSEQVVVAYQAERDTWLRNRNAARRAKVAAVLSGQSTNAQEVERSLGFPLTRPHVAAVLWCVEEVDEASRPGLLERQAGFVATALGASARSLLLVAADDSTLWAWVPLPVPSGGLDAETVIAAMDGASRSIGVTLGEPASGLDGFRVTHQQARLAQTLISGAERSHIGPVVLSSELGPLALVGSDAAGIRSWVQRVLGDLAVDDETSARLRETIWAYLSLGSSPNNAAAALHLHKNTIQYRIGKAEEVRGRSLDDGRLDLEVALLACRLLGAAVLRTPGS